MRAEGVLEVKFGIDLIRAWEAWSKSKNKDIRNASKRYYFQYRHLHDAWEAEYQRYCREIDAELDRQKNQHTTPAPGKTGG
jgi:hypothetical protein